MKVLEQALAVGAAGFVGALSRWGVTVLLRPWTNVFPLGTFVINVTGSFFLGWFITYFDTRYPGHDTLRLAIATGFVGAYTTFSTFMYESNVLIERGAFFWAAVNLMGSLAVGLLAVWLGVAVARRA